MVNSNLRLKTLFSAVLLTIGCLWLLSFQKDRLSIILTVISATAGIFLFRACMNRLSLMPLTFSASVIAYFGGCLTVSDSSFFLYYAGNVLTGLALGGPMFILPARLILAGFKGKMCLPLSFIWTVSILSVIALRVILSASPYAALNTAFIMLTAGSILLRNMPVFDFGFSPIAGTRNRKKSAGIKCFTLFTGTATALALSMASSVFFQVQPPAFEKNISVLLFIFGAVTGPFTAAFFSEKKGIFNGAILNIFLIEICVMCFSFYEKDIFLLYCGYLALGLSLSFPLTICPLITYYLFGPENYTGRLAGIFAFLLAGFWLTAPLNFIEQPVFFSSPAVIGTFILLLCSFFAVFSSWKRRLVLLKT